MKKPAIFMMILALSLAAVPAISQNNMPTNDEIAKVLQSFKNYRFGAISMYEVIDVTELKEWRKIRFSKSDAVSQEESAECIKQLETGVDELIRNGAEEEKTMNDIIENIITEGYALPERDVLECAYQYYVEQFLGPKEELVLRAYMVTSRPPKIGTIPDTIVGLLFSEKPFEESSGELKPNLETVPSEDVMSVDFLKEEKLDETKYGYRTLYDLLYAYFIQGNVQDKSMEAKGISSDIRFFAEKPGQTLPLINGEIISSMDVQKFMRISEGQPINYHENTQELLISPDQVKWTKFSPVYVRDATGKLRKDSLGNLLIDYRYPANAFLPDFGLEMKYGIDELYYPSFWSERMTISALWDNVKFGVILPTNGWSSFSTDIFDQQRMLTHAGIGIAGQLDFPFVLIPESGIFHLGFGYVFGNAEISEYKNRNLDPDIFVTNQFDNDYLIRAHGQLHYTFGISVDDDYYLRFGMGGTIYTMERWYNMLETTEEENKVVFKELDSETVGGVSGKIEFMATNTTTPYGGSIQYFDESLGINAWLQVPIIEDALVLRLDANGYVTAFKENLRDWERSSVIIPMARFIVIF